MPRSSARMSSQRRGAGEPFALVMARRVEMPIDTAGIFPLAARDQKGSHDGDDLLHSDATHASVGFWTTNVSRSRA